MTANAEPIEFIRRGDDGRSVEIVACGACGHLYSTAMHRGSPEAVLAATRDCAADCVMCRTDRVSPEDALEAARRHRLKAIAKATEVHDLTECFSDDGDTFYMDPSEAADAGETGVFGATFVPYSIDVGNVLAMAIDDHHDDASTDDLAEVDDLCRAVEAFNKAQKRGSYHMDEKIWQRIPQRRTFAMIKPDATQRGVEDRMMEDIVAAGFRIIEARRQVLSRADAEWLYREHAHKDHFTDLVDYTISGDVVLMLIEGDDDDVATAFRRLMGPTDRTTAAPHTLRARYAVGYRENSIHGSDSPAAAIDEIIRFMA